ncbi:2-hydroxyacyl-CoA dehydratase [Thermocaproicibacter melissae]|uniref:2-hydroxyacyl-CoA dehydratase n=1 Tax=Thermocaproicibacter melissae TaxID=2966552 RepID=UPI0024B08175|nr:2-hydroxyacyl-CoA dehydratase [Thermocaproicibacter melissae]WBY64900.1 2-hydroxyacyl-CoA dehydratase [Thermocaproicibacter melissae]
MAKLVYDKTGRLLFTKEMKKEYTILAPMMAPIHFRLIINVLRNCGYNFELLENDGPNVVQEGLKYVHNDTCYPALLVIGQFIDALHSGKYDVNKTALVITQTGGGCRASNYIHLLRKALKKAGLEQVPVISMNLSFLEHNPGFHITLSMIRKFVAAMVYGDALMLLRNQTEAYEVHKGDSNKMVEKWSNYLTDQFNHGKALSRKQQREILFRIVKDFASIEIKKVPKVKVGVVGEIYVKYSSLGNNNLEDFLRGQDCEVNVPGLINFALFKVDNRLEDIKLYGGNPIKYFFVNLLMKYLLEMQDTLIEAIKSEPRYHAPQPYAHTKSLINGVIGYGDKMGEGWLLTAEMLELAEEGYENIVCAQPFGCLPNHISGKGMIHRIKAINEKSNIVPIDYDPSATRVNQENRIKLMLAVARENLNKQLEQQNQPN